MIGGRRPLQGRKPGDRRVRVERPHAPYFRYTGSGTLTAKEAASVPTTPGARAIARVRAVLLGRPLHQEEELGERLSKTKALAIFSSDAISSSAYATEEIILAFILGGAALAALQWSLPVSIAIAGLLAIVAFSYRQVCIAYPTGGGSYSVSKANFGRLASLVAASALLIDYNLTAAVSTSSAVEQIVSAFPALSDVRVLIGVGALGLITLANLRGVREAGNIFAVPTYLFMFSAFAMIAIGAYRIIVLGEVHPPPPEVVAATADTAGAVSVFLLLRAFASGAVALTGTEAIATGVPAFKPPEAKQRRDDAAGDGRRPGHPVRRDHVPGHELRDLPDRARAVRRASSTRPSSPRWPRPSSADGVLFYLFQAFTALLLFLAANTSFAAFPRLAAVLGEDGFFPRQFSLRGDRLAFSMGILLLGLIAASLVIVAGGRTHALIPLYAVGVFIDFTISQAGHDPALAAHPRRRAGATGWRSTPSGCVGDGRRGDRRDQREVPRRGLARDRAHPDPRQHDAVHPARVRRPGARAARPRRPRRRGAASRAARRDPGQRHQPGGHPGGQLRTDDRAATCGRCS